MPLKKCNYLSYYLFIYLFLSFNFFLSILAIIFSLKEKFNAHINLRNNVDFVKNFVDLFDLLIEYRDLKLDSSDELKTFYLNEILVKIV